MSLIRIACTRRYRGRLFGKQEVFTGMRDFVHALSLMHTLEEVASFGIKH